MVTIVYGLDGASGSRPGIVLPRAEATTAPPVSGVGDVESREWLRCLRADGDVRQEALARLHALLLRAARFEVARRRVTLPHLRGNDFDDIAHEAADDALMSVLAHLDDFRGLSRFTTWVYKFALFEAAVKLRRRAWQGREVPIEPEAWTQFASLGLEPAEELEQRELLSMLQQAIAEILTPHQRRSTRRAGAQRRPDRRSRRTTAHDPRRALQDASRGAKKTARTPDRDGPCAECVGD